MKTLIVEDDFISRKVLQRLLAVYGECDVAVDGREAVTAFGLAMEEGKPYELVCLDILMPELDGRETLREMRAIEARHGRDGLNGAKVIMTTALDGAHDVLGSFRDGCEAYIIKPVSKGALVRELVRLGLVDEKDIHI